MSNSPNSSFELEDVNCNTTNLGYGTRAAGKNGRKRLWTNEDDNHETKKLRGRGKLYVKVRDLESEKAAEDFLRSEVSSMKFFNA